MTDFLGNELQIGNSVIFIDRPSTGAAELSKGIVAKIERGIVHIQREYSDGSLDEFDWAYGRCRGWNVVKLNLQQQNERLQTVGNKK